MTHPTRKDEPTYLVNLTIRASTTIPFARTTAEEDGEEIRPSDAIENALWSGINDGSYGPGNDVRTVEGLLKSLGFEVALPIEGEATLL